jgi:malate/lactate dehydrogenase
MKAGIVGVGKLGGTIAFALAQEPVLDELILCDVVEPLAWAQAEDIRDGLHGKTVPVVRAGKLADLHNTDVVVLAAGQGRKPGMTRLNLLHTNAGLVADLGREIAKTAPRATMIILTNPVDVMTTVAWEASGLPRERVIGSGGLVDSMRLRYLLADRFGVHPSDVEAIVIGEHGDRAVPVFSLARIHGKPIEISPKEKDDIRQDLKTVSAKIIELKGGTAFGPAGATAALLRALLSRTPSTVPASVVLAGEYGMRDLAIGAPAVLGHGHLVKVEEWPLLPDEQVAFQDAGHDLGEFAKDAAVILGLAVRHTTLEKLSGSARR